MRIGIFILVVGTLFAGPRSLQSIYTSLDPTSIFQHFAFYELYPDTTLGKQALQHGWALLQEHPKLPPQVLPPIDLQPLIQFVNRTPNTTQAPLLHDTQLQIIEELAQHLHNRTLKGFGLWSAQTMASLPVQEIDLARALFLAELEQDTPEARRRIRSYEAEIDLMALQLLARFPKQATPLQKIRAINDLLFHELRFRFPPQSLGTKEIDLYTFLPSVLDSRRGVCLGVSILYLCLAQRLGIELEAVTPPGHIYVRYRDPQTEEVTNIETTARGIHLPSETYLGIETRCLQQRSIREVVGIAFMNQAAVTWHRGDYERTVQLYERAKTYLSDDDYLLNMFLGFNYLFVNRKEEGIALLNKIRGVIPEHMLSADTISEDYLSGRTDVEGIQAVFMEVDETRKSILDKQLRLKKVLARYPYFCQGLFHLAVTYLQLGREKEALPHLTRYAQLVSHDPTAHYYLAAIHMQRFNFQEAWNYLQKTEEIVSEKNHQPRVLKELRLSLQKACPEPIGSCSKNQRGEI
jgi:tetratricopeptide (TPR) repeat protein